MKQTLASHSSTSEFNASVPSATPPRLQEKIKVVELLYNSLCGSENFYDEFFSGFFLKKYKENYGEELNVKEYYITRINSKVLELYKLYGPEVCSNKFSKLNLKYFPEELIKYMKIQVFDYKEYIILDKDKIYKEFYSQVMKNNIHIDEIRSNYERIEYIIETYHKYPKCDNELFRCEV